MEKKRTRINLNGEVIEVEVEVLPPGICIGAIPTYPEKYISPWTIGVAAFAEGKTIYKKTKEKGGVR